MNTTLRYVTAIVLTAVSIGLVGVLVPVMGNVNLFFLLVLWVIIWVAATKLRRRFALLLAAVAALAMTFPPVHTYVSIVGDRPQFHFIGFEHLFDRSIWAMLYAFAFHLAIFASVTFLIGRKRVGDANLS